ncbi:hypothetical protein RhiXN_09331 [Rhizoctonia solani]|uniref:Uncharacterized protein n=1 Tax=Rhizoctonia solani TaxID=456999 RepID=A0A8H8NUM2_9AGAM|nr:uncharacterized protein RhiXN_09331 [Rhizoctonia solani]QRW20356.1 hypothetical protein RhiXN_09331 [Rhizoctonia solani]
MVDNQSQNLGGGSAAQNSRVPGLGSGNQPEAAPTSTVANQVGPTDASLDSRFAHNIVATTDQVPVNPQQTQQPESIIKSLIGFSQIR